MRAFLEFVDELGDRAMTERREGATADRIERFQELVRHPLPPFYVEFLEWFGERSLIDLGRDGTQRVADLITL